MIEQTTALLTTAVTALAVVFIALVASASICKFFGDITGE